MKNLPFHLPIYRRDAVVMLGDVGLFVGRGLFLSGKKKAMTVGGIIILRASDRDIHSMCSLFGGDVRR